MEPIKLRLISRKPYIVTVTEDQDVASNTIGIIEVVCKGKQTFDEIVMRLLESHLAVAAVQQAIHCLQMAKSPADRVADLRMLDDVHFRLTGYHFDSAATPAPIEGVEPSSGSISMEEARKMFGELDPDKIGKRLDSPSLFRRLSGKVYVDPGVEIVQDFHPSALKE